MINSNFFMLVARVCATFFFLYGMGEREGTKVSYYKIQGGTLTGIADAIRAKNGEALAYAPTEMAAAIGEIQTGTALNVAYGDTESEDTSKLWVKTAEPEAVQVRAKLNGANEAVTLGISALPVAAHYIAGAAVEEKVYLFGGGADITGDDQYTSTIRVFNTKNGELETLSTTLPNRAYAVAAAAVGTKIYLFGGKNSSYLNDILLFDTQTNTITTLSTELPKAMGYAAAVAVGTKVYVFGGYAGSNVNTIHVFDANTHTISTLSAKLPTLSSEIAAAAVGTKVYLFGGDGSETSIQVFDTETNTISTLSTTLPVGSYAIGVAAVGTSVYLFGGHDYLTTILRFDTEAQSISELGAKLPTGAHNIAAAAVGTSVYLFGGAASDNKLLNTINEFVVSVPLEENNILIEVSLTENLMELLPGMEIGVGNVYRGNASGVAEKVAAAVYKDGAWVEI